MLGRLLRWSALGLAAAVAAVVILYVRDLARARERVSGRSTVIPSPYGDIEYTEHGSGSPVLVIHGSGGGYDQGELIAEAVLAGPFRVITPSRFGYLRSTYAAGATFDEQAHAYAHLLDRLGIEKAAVVAMSHGGPSALLFAALHPERVTSLTLLSAGVASSTSADQAEANQKGNLLTTVFRHDPLYWGVTTAFRTQFMTLMGANDAVISSLTADQRRLANQVIDFMNPVSRRTAGVVFDNGAAMPNERIAAIRAPTLIVHASDDALQLFHNAEFAASRIPGARMARFERGGHLLIIVEQAAVRALVQSHLTEHGAGRDQAVD